MKKIFLFLIILLISSCSKPKTVLICGDHVCVNKAEANQFFEENLSIEVRIIKKDINKENDLVELNLNNNNEERKVSITRKKVTKEEVKTLSKKEVKIIKDNIKKKKKVKNIKNNMHLKKDRKQVLDKKNNNIEKKKKKPSIDIKTKKRKSSFDDICSILDKCTIDEISKYLLKEGRKKNYPDITLRQ